jgi:hypothetical protein
MSLDKKYKKINEVTYRMDQRIYKIQNMKKNMKEFDEYLEKKGPCPPIPNVTKLRQRNVIELSLLELDRDEIRKEEKQIEQQMEQVFKVNKENSHYKKITKPEKRRLEREICALCCEDHNIKQIVTTNCGHSFGKLCFSKMLEHNFDYDLTLRCPCCRNEPIELTRYTSHYTDQKEK